MKRKVLLTVGILLALAAVYFGARALWSLGTPEAGTPPPLREETAVPAVQSAPSVPEPETAAEETPPTEEAPVETPPVEEPEPPEGEPVEEEAPEPYVSPIDFEALQAGNPDVYAWLEIEGTDISYPLLQSATDDAFYLDHDSEGNRSANGSLFSESRYNGRTMEDPVTLIYGHHMRSGAMFGNLERDYSDGEFFEAHLTITVYTPEAELHYGVFAAVPHTGEHLLYYNDFGDETEYRRFFASVFRIRDLRARFHEENAPEPGDRVLILSTCLAADNKQRYLVMAKQLP